MLKNNDTSTPVWTNYDRITNMSIRELAQSGYIPCPYMEDDYDECKFGWHERTQTCEECIEEWLKMPCGR